MCAARVVLLLLGGVAAVLLCSDVHVLAQATPPVLRGFSPSSGPLSGGSTLHVLGNGFSASGPGRSKCVFEDSSLGSAVSETNHVQQNGSYLTCVMPEIGFLRSLNLSEGRRVKLAVTTGGGLRSNSLDFLVFNLSTMRISGINVSEGFNNSRNEVEIFGSGFISTGEIACAYGSINAEDEMFYTPAFFVNSSSVRCVLSTFPYPAQVTVRVYANGQPSSSISADPIDSNLFTFFSTAPVVTSCEFSASYVSVAVIFDREVEIGGERATNLTTPPECSLLFINETRHMLGRGAVCAWLNEQQRTIVIDLSRDSLLVEGSMLSFRGGNIRTRNVAFSRLTSGGTSVGLNSELLLPVPVIDAPQVIPYCGNFTASGHNSQYGGYQPLEYRWTIQRVTRDGIINVSGSGSLIDTYVHRTFQKDPLLVIPVAFFNVSTEYLVHLEVRNFLNATAHSAVPVTKLNLPAPDVLIRGSRKRLVAADGEITLEGVAQLPDCLGGSAINTLAYTWRVVPETEIVDSSASGESSASSRLDLVEVDLGDANVNTAILVIPPYTLLPDASYVAIFTAETSGGQVGHSSVALDTELAGIRARIDGGMLRAVWIEERIVLDGRVSEGLESADREFLTASWNCTSVSGESEANTSCADVAETANSTLQLEIEPRSLAAGVYCFTLTLAYQNLASSTGQVLNVVEHQVPLVSIEPPQRLHAFAVHEKLLIWAVVVSNYTGTLTWTSENIPGESRIIVAD